MYNERGFPILELTAKEFHILPRSEKLSSRFWESCELGFKFRYGGRSIRQSGVGEVVDVQNTLPRQGNLGSIALPGRYINHYVPVLKGS